MSVASKIGNKLLSMFNEKKSSSAVQATNAAAELEAAQEMARKETLRLSKTARIGFPYKPTCIAFDMVQHVLAIGTKSGCVKLYGGESIEYTIYHTTNQASSNLSASSIGHGNGGSSSSLGQTASNINSTGSNPSSGVGSPNLSLNSSITPAVIFMSFVINQGALITYCDDCTISFWNLRQKKPGILFSKKLVNEKQVFLYHLFLN
jgi:hypothetical protein